MICRILRNDQLKTELYINTKKTKAFLATGKRLQHNLRVETASLQLHFNATNINQILHHKLLGLIIDKDLRFEAHIDELSKRLKLFLSQVKPQINFLTCSFFFSLIVIYLQNTCYSYKILKLKESI